MDVPLLLLLLVIAIVLVPGDALNPAAIKQKLDRSREQRERQPSRLKESFGILGWGQRSHGECQQSGLTKHNNPSMSQLKLAPHHQMLVSRRLSNGVSDR